MRRLEDAQIDIELERRGVASQNLRQLDMERVRAHRLDGALLSAQKRKQVVDERWIGRTFAQIFARLGRVYRPEMT
jgi:hypothetical protein